MEITVNQAIVAHQEGRLEEAERLYRSILENQPTNLDVNNNLGVLLFNLGKYNEAEASYKKAIELKPDYVEAHYNLGLTLQKLGKYNEAEASYRKAIELKPNYAEAYNDLGSILHHQTKLDKAKKYYKKSTELKPDFAKAHNNLGAILQDLGKLDEAETSYRKAIELKVGFTDTYKNLSYLSKQKKLLLNIQQIKKPLNKIKTNFNGKDNVKLLLSEPGLISDPFISEREVEAELINDLHKVNYEILEKTSKRDARFGNGKCSDFNLFKSDFSIIKKIEKDLINIMKEAVKSDIFIMDSWLNIYRAGSGTIPHKHIDNFDTSVGLVNQKYSLTYYLSIGDQNCSEPGNLKVYNPDKEISLSKGMIVIIPASRKHSAVYNGEKDRVMIGVNFYSLI